MYTDMISSLKSITMLHRFLSVSLAWENSQSHFLGGPFFAQTHSHVSSKFISLQVKRDRNCYSLCVYEEPNMRKDGVKCIKTPKKSIQD